MVLCLLALSFRTSASLSLTSLFRLFTLLSHPALPRGWCLREGNVSHTAAASVAALLSTTLTHKMQIIGASALTPLSLLFSPLSSSLPGWMISWLVYMCSRSSQEFTSTLPDSFEVCGLWGR